MAVNLNQYPIANAELASLLGSNKAGSVEGTNQTSGLVGPSELEKAQNSSEEATFVFSEFLSKSEKEIDIRSAQAANMARVINIQKIQELFTQITGEPKESLSELAKRLIADMASGGDPSDIVGKMEADPTKQFLILREAAHQSARDVLAQRKLETAIHLVEEQVFGRGFLASRAIKADVNSAPAIASASGADKRVGNLLRETYRQLVCGFEGVAEMALHLLEKYPESQIATAMKTLGRALADDLRSKTTSAQPEKMDAAMKDLQAIFTIQSTLAACEKALRTVTSKGGVMKRSSARVATDLVRLTQLKPSERFLTDVLLEHVGGEKPLRLAYLASCSQIFGHTIPGRIWPAEDSKEEWVGMISNYLNREDPRELQAV